MDGHVLVLDGTPKAAHPLQRRVERYRIYVGSEERWMTGYAFAWLVQIAVARVLSPTGAISFDELGDVGGNGARYLYRIRHESGLEFDSFPTVPKCHTRLRTEPKLIFFNHRQLAEFEHAIVQRSVAENAAKLQEVA